MRGHRTGSLRAVATALGVVSVLALLSPAAAASPRLDTARGRAATLTAAVDRLQLQAEQATETYDEAVDEMSRLTATKALGEQQLGVLQASARAHQARTGDHARMLYESGGSLGLMATVLDSGDPAALLDRAHLAAAVVSGDTLAQDTADATAREASGIAVRLAVLDKRQSQLAAKAHGGAARVQELLARTSALLAAAGADVRRIADQERRAAEAAAAASFAARTAAARSLLGGAVGGAVGGLAGTTNLSPPGAAAAAAIAAARTRLGAPYVWGATGPDTFDCSGLTGWAYRQAGVSLPRTSRQQWFAAPHPTLAQLAPGDLVFWATDTANPATIHHVALYLGDNLMVAAPHTGDVVRIQPVYATGYLGAVRPTAG